MGSKERAYKIWAGEHRWKSRGEDSGQGLIVWLQEGGGVTERDPSTAGLRRGE